MVIRAVLAAFVMLVTIVNARAEESGAPPPSRAVSSAINITASRSPAVIESFANTQKKPWIHPDLSAELTGKLAIAIEIANARINSLPACSGLFRKLGSEAADTLGSVFILPAQDQHEKSVCNRVVALTMMGTSKTWVCQSLAELSDRQVAMVLIHEALHHAGLRERPKKVGSRIRDRTAMTSTEINQMVSISCRL